MAYRLKKGVVLFDMCGESFLFPSRSSGVKLGFLLPAPPALAGLLRRENGPESLSGEELNKLRRLVKTGLVEEYEA